jgi:hypothetical protein
MAVDSNAVFSPSEFENRPVRNGDRSSGHRLTWIVSARNVEVPGINRCLEHLLPLGDARMKNVPPVTRKQSDAQKCLARPPERGRAQAPQSRPASPELRA